MFHRLLILASLALTALATKAPSMPNYHLVWADEFKFTGGAVNFVDRTKWNIVTGPGTASNHELQTYTDSVANLHVLGGDFLGIAPQHSGNDPLTGWTSGRIESQSSFTCEDGKKMVFQAEIKMGQRLDLQKGFWPAFWALGDSKRRGTPWPQCGEWDIMETRNGENRMWNAIHGGLGGKDNPDQTHVGIDFTYDPNTYHTWAIKIDRTNSNWQDQIIRWYMDGKETSSITGAQVGNLQKWDYLARSPFYVVLNVAVGGNCPAGPCTPDTTTGGGFASQMEVKYVAVYASN